MISSLSINNALSSCGREAWQTLSMRESQTLGEILKERRKDVGLSGPQIAKMLRDKWGKQGRSQPWISSLERDTADIMELDGEVRLHLLELYGFTPKEIKELNQRFRLRIHKPPNVENVTSDAPVSLGNVDGVTIRNVGNPNEGGYTLPLDALQGHKPEDCFFVTAKGGIFACPEVRATHGALTKIFFDRTKKPEEGSMVAYKIKAEDSYVLKVWHETPPPVPVTVQTYDQTRYIVLYPDDPVLEQLGTKFSHLGFGDR